MDDLTILRRIDGLLASPQDWTQGSFGDGQRRCLLQAGRDAMNGWWKVRPHGRDQRIARVLGFNDKHMVPRWNDHEATTFQGVRDLIEQRYRALDPDSHYPDLSQRTEYDSHNYPLAGD